MSCADPEKVTNSSSPNWNFSLFLLHFLGNSNFCLIEERSKNGTGKSHHVIAQRLLDNKSRKCSFEVAQSFRHKNDGWFF
jgi:hypothetical protein